MVQIGAVYIWSYVYAIMRLSANKATKEIDSNESTIQDSASGEITYSEICPEALLLPSRGSPTSQEDTDQAEVPSTKSEGKAKVSAHLILLWISIYDLQSFLFSKFDY